MFWWQRAARDLVKTLTRIMLQLGATTYRSFAFSNERERYRISRSFCITITTYQTNTKQTFARSKTNPNKKNPVSVGNLNKFYALMKREYRVRLQSASK